MKDAYNLREQDFESLLGLFSDDREEAGRIYEKLRSGLTRFFQYRGCSDPERLVDETFDRVASKADSYETTKSANATGYIYGFARNILLEQSRKKEVQLEREHWEMQTADRDIVDAKDKAFECLNKCLEKLPKSDSRLVLEYYCRERDEKIATRRRLASNAECSPAALHLKIFRIKGRLRTCVEKCKGNGS